jgi:hypothetical protein
VGSLAGTLAEIATRVETREGSGDEVRLGMSVQEGDFDEEGVRFRRGGVTEFFALLSLAARRAGRAEAACETVWAPTRFCAFLAARRSSKDSLCSLIACAAEA